MNALPRLLLTAALCLANVPANAATSTDDWVPPANKPVSGPIANFMRANDGWHVTVSLPEPAIAMAWRIGDSGPWRDTGFLDTVDPRTQRRMPNPGFPLDPHTGATTIYVRYADASGAAHEPVAIPFDPMTELVRSQRQILDTLQNDWVSFRNFNGVLLYFTTLVSYRCAIEEVRIGIDAPRGGKPLRLPPCDPDNPGAIPANYAPYLQVPANTRSATVEVTFRDGTTSPVRTFQR